MAGQAFWRLPPASRGAAVCWSISQHIWKIVSDTVTLFNLKEQKTQRELLTTRSNLNVSPWAPSLWWNPQTQTSHLTVVIMSIKAVVWLVFSWTTKKSFSGFWIQKFLGDHHQGFWNKWSVPEVLLLEFDSCVMWRGLSPQINISGESRTRVSPELR